MSPVGFNRPLHYFALFASAATLALVGLGGLVTSHGVGMAVPDWPNTYGYNMFFFPVSQWVGGIFYEHTHRLLASAVGFFTLVLAFWLHGRAARAWLRGFGLVLLALAVLTVFRWPARTADALVLGSTGGVALIASVFWPRWQGAPRWLRRLGIVACVAVIVQGILGGLRVTKLMDELGIFHATLAQLFFALMCAIALFTSRYWTRGAGLGTPQERSLIGSAFLPATLLILAQLILGATMRHQHAGLAIPDFPLAYGKLIPPTDPASVARYNQQRLEITALAPITATQIYLQLVHRAVALLILIAIGNALWQASRKLGNGHPLTKITFFWVGLILIQIALGAATIWSNKAADVATAHVVVGLLSLATGAIACIVSCRGARPLAAREQDATENFPAGCAVRPPSPSGGIV